MNRSLSLALASLAALGMASAAVAAPSLQRVRGVIELVSGDTLTLRQADGQEARIALGADTKYASVVAASLADLKPGDFIGTATKGPAGSLMALELVIFPESMRGMGEGQYPWDALPDSTAGGGSTASTMTNGNVVSASAAAAAPQVQTTMTNGSVTAGSGGAGGKRITVSYDGKSSEIMVPPSATIVRFVPGGRSLAVAGGKAFVVAKSGGGTLDAAFVAVGKDGVTPPM